MKITEDLVKSVFVGVFTGVFAFVLLYLLFDKFGTDNTTDVEKTIAQIFNELPFSALPYFFAVVIGGYACSFTNMILKKRRSADEENPQ